MVTKPKLTYFNYRGAAEPIRYLLALTETEYEDVRIKDEDFPAVKLNFPYGQIPVLEVKDKVINQSIPICRYLAKQCGLAGSDDFEALQIDAVADTILDLRNIFTDCYWITSEDQRPPKLEKLKKETLPFYLGRFEKALENNGGHFVNGKLSFADIIFAGSYQHFSDYFGSNITDGYPLLKALVEKVENIPKIKAWISKRPVTPY